MDGTISRAEFQAWMERLDNGIEGVHHRLDQLNGRTRTNESDIAVLRDRSDRMEIHQQEQAKQGGYAGAGAGGAVVALYELGKLFWSAWGNRP